MNFNSQNATVKHHIIEVVKKESGQCTEEWRAQYERDPDIASEGSGVSMARLGRHLQAGQMLPGAVVLDCEDSLEGIMDPPTATVAMYEDVSQWDEIQFPFESQLIKLSEGLFALVYGVMDKGERPDEKYYNVATYSSESIDILSGKGSTGWRALDISFQLNANNPKAVLTDKLYDAAPEDKQAEMARAVTFIQLHLYVILYLLKHKKVEFGQVQVPTSRNSKRQRRNLPPYCEYKQAILGDYTRRPTRYREGDEISTHASPKMHMRCGHWRRRPHSEEKLWIRSTVVGDPSRGIVMKEYKL